MKIKHWTWALLTLIVLDSIYTIWWGYEANPLIIWCMNKFNISLTWTMIIRIFYCLPFLYIVNKYDWSKLTFISYIGIYFALSGIQFI